MAVVFNEKSFTIEVQTGGEPIEDWLELHNELVTILRIIDKDLYDETPWRILSLIIEMMPEWKVARKMAMQLT